jgi:hypothetical protein
MATMTISITVSWNGMTWRRTTTDTVDDAMMQTGTTNAASITLGTEAASSSSGIHSYQGVGIAFFANKGRGSTAKVRLNSAGGYVAGVLLPTHLPFVVYAGAGTGFSGAVKGSATATDTPTEDITSVTLAAASGTQNTMALIGLKLIS